LSKSFKRRLIEPVPPQSIARNNSSNSRDEISCIQRRENTKLVGKPEGKRPLGRPRRRWVDNIKMEVREIGMAGMDWIELAQDRDQWRALVNTVMNLRVP
jgi:hypothetical protein